jgi:spermidine synthase
VICFGMGTTFRAMHAWGIAVTAVELVPSVPRLFGYLHADAADILGSPRARVVIDDGRRFLERVPDPFDVITIDPPPPVEAAGAGLLYSREFYALAKRRLTDHGILQQWWPGGEAEVLVAVTRALREEFPHLRAYPSVEGWVFHFLASRKPIEVPPAATLAARLPAATARDLLEWGPASTAVAQFDAMLRHEIPIAAILAERPDAPAMHDERPVNEYYLVRRTRAALGSR